MGVAVVMAVMVAVAMVVAVMVNSTVITVPLLHQCGSQEKNKKSAPASGRYP